MELVDLTGQRFGRLVVESEAVPSIYRTSKRLVKKRKWMCLCDCGNRCVVQMANLTSGHTRSCGCLSKENKENFVRSATTHGEYKTRLYRIWNDMRMRTTDPNRGSYIRYGARGITVCGEWYQSYETFREWAFQNGYSESLSLDRIDTNGNYEPKNCRWVTVKEQANNRRSNRWIEFGGTTHTLTEWAELTGINLGTIRSRLERGWSVEKALTRQPNSRKVLSE